MTGTKVGCLSSRTDTTQRARSAALISASVIVSPPRYFSSSRSSDSLTFSISFSRYSCALACRSAGNLLDLVRGAHGLVVVDERLHPDQVDDAR